MKAPRYNRDSFITLGLLGVGGFLLFRAIKGLLDFNKGTPYAGGGVVGTAANATNKILGGVPQAIGESIGGKLADWFQKSAAEVTVYNVLLPDGTRTGVPSSAVSGDGYFIRNGVRFRMAVDKSITSGPNKFAVRA